MARKMQIQIQFDSPLGFSFILRIIICNCIKNKYLAPSKQKIALTQVLTIKSTWQDKFRKIRYHKNHLKWTINGEYLNQ